MTTSDKPINFIQQIINADIDAGQVGQVVTRFPPEPNGYLHIGHAKAICVNFGLAQEYGGHCHLRFDDTNPERESEEFVQAIIEDVRWLGFQWHGDVRYASSYFSQLYTWATYLVQHNLAYVCELNAQQMRDYRGTLTEGGKDSPHRDRPVEESLHLLEQMKQGHIDEGRMTLRAKIDMQSPNINLRDPVLYRVKKLAHHRTGSDWNIYPSYDFAHGQEDAIEGVTHSICTLEFAANRPLYNWFIEHLPVPSKPRQYEFGRLKVNYMVTSKRKLKLLVDQGQVDGWDDPRMPTLSGMRRRGVTPTAIRNFCDSLAVAKTDGVVDIGQLEHFIRDDLNRDARRAMCVLDPVKLVIENYPAEKHESFNASVHPNREDMGTREVHFSRHLWIDRSDFSEDSSLSRKKYKRLVLGDYVRLRGAYVVRADQVFKDQQGNLVEIHASLVPDTVGANPPEGCKPRGVIHWVCADRSIECTVHRYDRLFSQPLADSAEQTFTDCLNPDSLEVIKNCQAEAALGDARVGEHYQFEREGYYCLDSGAGNDGELVFNCTIGLRDTWQK